MKSKKMYLLAFLLVFFLTLSCAYANEDQIAENTFSGDLNEVDLSSSVDDELAVSESGLSDTSNDDLLVSESGLSDTSNDDSLVFADSSSEISDDDLIDSSEVLSGTNYADLVIKDISFAGNSTHLNIQGFSQNGLVMSDFVMSIIPSSDSSQFDLNMKIPEVKYTDYNNTMFVFENLDLSILPSSDPSSLYFSAIMDYLNLRTGDNYVNMEDLRLLFKSYPEVNGVNLAIAISNLIYTNLKDMSLYMDDLDLDMALGLDGESMNIKILLPVMNLINKDDIIDLTGLDLSIVLPDLKLANLDVSVLMSDFKYTRPDGGTLNLTDLVLSLEPTLNSTDFNTLIKMSSFNFTGINSSDLQFPGFNINGLDFENFTTGLDLSNVDLSGIVSILDVSKMDLSAIVSYLSSGFDIVTYTDNMPGQHESYLDFNAVDLSSTDYPI